MGEHWWMVIAYDYGALDCIQSSDLCLTSGLIMPKEHNGTDLLFSESWQPRTQAFATDFYVSRISHKMKYGSTISLSLMM